MAKFISFLLLLTLSAIFTQNSDAQEDQAQVMMVGIFHFQNPGLDAVKTDTMNVLDEKSQAYLDDLAQKIATEFKPTIIMLEYQEKNDEIIQKKYQNYLDGTYDLEVNEIYQVGFRIAKASQNSIIKSVDDRSQGWEVGPLNKILAQSDPKIKAEQDQMIKSFIEEMNTNMSTLSLREMLMKHNTTEFDDLNKNTYLMTNPVATEGNYEGSNAASSWWKRNFRMYAKIQRAAQPGERVLVIAGQGHTAILKDFLKIDQRIKAIDPSPFLN